MLQKRKPIFLLAAIMLVICMAFDKWHYYGNGQTIIKTLDGSIGQLKQDSVVLIEDPIFFDNELQGTLIKPYQVQNLVSLEVNEDALAMVQSNFNASVRLQIKKTDASQQVTTSTVDLVLDYKRDGASAHRKTHIFNNAYRVEVKVLSVNKGTATWDVFSVLKIVNKLQSFPEFNFHCTDNAVKSISITGTTPPPNTILDELPVNWPGVIQADEYDLEWAFLEKVALDNGRYGNSASPDPQLIFTNNASRVTITGTSYKIPLFYDKEGELFFRVRSVHWSSKLGPEGGRMEANWSSSFPGGLGRFLFMGHEQALNWQSTTSFAEDGKRKSVVQYYDGSLRSRQTVTKDNVSNSTIATESFYDYQGRPVIQVMPVPTLKNVIGYTRGLNRSPGKPDYDKSLYDTLPDPNQYCGIQAVPMDTSYTDTMSASRYYSPANDSVVIPRMEGRPVDPRFAYIPDAEQYPFTEVEYTQDNTGRINRQSGVGKAFRMGAGRETQYAYSTPEQKELDALFGTEVGYASHYQKSIVRDANGQFSIGYVDMRGRTVATALVGSLPTDIKLDPLSSASLEPRMRKLSDPASSILRDLVMESKNSIEVTRDNAVHEFVYTLNPESLELEGAGEEPTTFCYDCLYDLQITIASDCNNGKLPNGVAFDTLIRNFSFANIDTTCTPAQGFNVSFTLLLNKGTYDITKKLSVSQSSIDYYRDSLFMKRNRFFDLQSFIEEQRAIVNLNASCKPECSGCLDSLGTWTIFWTRYKTTNQIAEVDASKYFNQAQTAYNDARNSCNELCGVSTDSLGLRQAMMADLTPPFGQYANPARDYNPYSIFNNTNPYFRSITDYKDENGNPAMVYSPNAGKSLPPQELSDNEFIENFQESWAESLLPQHPEYCLLQKHEILNKSHQWDRKIELVDSYDDARKKGYLNPTGAISSPFSSYAGIVPLDNDPLATLVGGYFKSSLESAIGSNFKGSGMSLYSVASISVMCNPGTDLACVNKYKGATALATAPELCAADRDLIWTTFRSMYLQVKRDLINTWMRSQCAGAPTGKSLTDSNYVPHFSTSTDLLQKEGFTVPNSQLSADNEKAKAETEAKKYYESNCKAYVEYWIKTLGASCANYDTADLRATVIPKLLKVCTEGADLDHPQGSSSVAPSSNNLYRSFEDVISEYNRSKNIKDNGCNTYSIEVPRPYDQQSPNSRKPLIGKPSDCECELINKYNNEYLKKTNRFRSFGDYMKRQYATVLDDSTAVYLVAACNNSNIDCSAKKDIVSLPTAFQCGTGDICIDCDQFTRLDSAFRKTYPGVLPSNDSGLNDSIQISWNRFYEQFMNYKLGYTKTASEYLDFASRCGVSYSTPCNNLNRLYWDFDQQREVNQTATECKTSFRNYFNLKNNSSLTYEQIDSLYFRTCGRSPDPCGKTADTLLNIVDTFYRNYIPSRIIPVLESPNLPAPNHFINDPQKNMRDGIFQYPAALQTSDLSTKPYYNIYAAPGTELCMSKGFSLETKAKFISNPNGSQLAHIFSFEFPDNVMAKLLKGYPTAGIYLSDVWMWGPNGWTNYLPTPVKVMDDYNTFFTQWNTYKLQIDNDSIRFYCNGVKLHAMRNLRGYVTNQNKLGFSAGGYLAQYDWIRVRDKNENTVMFEDFTNPDKLAQFDPSFLCATASPCQTSFANYFNQKRNTSYSYSQIDSLFLIYTGRNLDVCAGMNKADTILNIVDRFNKNYDPSRIMPIINAGGLPAPNNWIDDPHKIIRNGIYQFPAALQSDADPAQKPYQAIYAPSGTVLCTNQGFSVETRAKFLRNPSGSQLAQLFTFEFTGNATAKILKGYPTAGIYLSDLWLRDINGNWANYLPTPVKLFDDYNTFFTQWNTYKLFIDKDSVKFYCNGIKMVALRNPRGLVQNSSDFSFSPGGYLAQFDWIKVSDRKGNIQMFEDFNDPDKLARFNPSFICATAAPCQSAFVSYYNQQQGTNYSYVQIDSLYHHLTGRSLDVCGAMDSLIMVKKKYNRDANPYRANLIHFLNLGAGVPNQTYTNQGYSFDNGIFRWPDFLRDTAAYNNWWRYSNLGAPNPSRFCGENGFTIEGKVKLLKEHPNSENFTISVGGNFSIVLYKQKSQSSSVYGFAVSRILVRNHAGTDTIKYDALQNADYRISTDTAFLTKKWHTFKIKVTLTTIFFYWNDSLICQGMFPSGVLPRNFGGVQVGFMGTYGMIDWMKIYNHKDELMLHETYDDPVERTLINPDMLCPKPTSVDCSTAFLNYFNQRKGTNYTYAKLDSLYKTMTGTGLNLCDHSVKQMLCGRATSAFPTIYEDELTQCSDSTFFMESKAQTFYQNYIDSLRGTFDSLYKAKCLQAYKFEQFTVRDTASEYHYTLYYYDQAGNLVKTVPPSGVRPNRDPVWLQNVKTARENGLTLTPDHELPTNYRYNALNQVVAQKSPDGGLSKFWYDRLGRLVISQNAKQRYAAATEENRLYSYTQYDDLGRIKEVGQVKNLASNDAMSDIISRSQASLETWLATLSQRREQITATVYDLPYPGFEEVIDNSQLIRQRHLRNRVSYTTYTDGWNTTNYNQGTFYTYDIHGNVDTLLQDYGCGSCSESEVFNLMNQNGNRFKKISYNYDLISGKVNSVAYQKGWSDQFFHRYSYDGENRLALVETSLDGYTWEKDARYEYYFHGPLARTVLGNQQVQGIDYAYTLQGWLKGVNSAGATDSFDIGGDGRITSPNRYIARDAFGFTLNYHGNDYKAIHEDVNPFPGYSAHLNTDFRPLYNGNISSMVSTNRVFENPAAHPDSATLLFNYRYDQLNRITGMDVFNKFDRITNCYTGLAKLEQFKERVSYDGNGNILKYLRNGNNAAHFRMDSLAYSYYPGTNRLRHVRDSVPSNWYGANLTDKIIDIDDQADADNYIYDSIGNLIQDKAEKINNIDWNVYGKITGISRGAGLHVPASEIRYTYDAAGNRISKSVEKNGYKTITWYVRDAQGNVMATYSSDTTSATPLQGFVLNESERYIYGSSRLGVVNIIQPVDNGNAGPAAVIDTGGLFVRGERTYELGNHLGNVLVTISDRKKGVADPLNAALIKFFEPVMLRGTDYYPFGMAMRVGGENKYKYGFNGKENDNEVKGGDGLQQDYGMRVYDPRLGKFLSVDPLQNKFPWNSPYAYAENDVIRSVDLDGLEKVYHYEVNYDKFTPVLKKVENKGPLSTFSYTLSFPRENKTYSSDTYSNLDVGYGSEFVQQAFWGGVFGTNPIYGTPPTTMEGLIQGYNRFAEQTQGWINRSYENSNEAIANNMLAGSFPLMMSMSSSMGSSMANSIRASSTSPMGASSTKAASPSSSTNAQASRVNNGNSQAAQSNTSEKFAGRILIVDENLSPDLAAKLKDAGYNVKVFPKGTLDADIIKFADKTKAIVMTNNLRDFNKKGITTLKVSENMKQKAQIGTVLNAVENVNNKSKTNTTLLDAGKNVSLAENKTQ